MEQGLKGKKILVTGGCGFIGSHIVDGLLGAEAKVVVLDNLSSGKLANISHCQEKIEFVQGDIRDEGSLEKAFSGIDCICHQAALRSVPKSVNRPADYNDVNVTGTLRLFIKAKEKGIKKIVCASSSSVYGDREDFPEKETDVALPISPYAATKLIVEHYAYVFSKLYGMEIANLRYFNVYGPRQSLDDDYAVVVPKFIHCLLNEKRPPIYGDGKQERDFTYIQNVVTANLRALSAAGLSGQVFNVADGKPKSVNYLLDVLNQVTGRRVIAQYLPERAGDVRKTHAQIETARKFLGWDPEVDFTEGLRRTVEWFKKEQAKKI